MKILVCISCVPDTTSKVSFTDENKFNKDNIQFIIGPYEDYETSKNMREKLLKEGFKANLIKLTRPKTQ